ncbi:hypothetical protein [Enterobacter roggenkampii]|uniref:hypothetical protein n=1 Tax=Enterobacter roggenkampii TaxID=1812935 RepID=UPI0032AFD133
MPSYLSVHDIDVLDRQTKKDILAHNKAWQANCQKKNGGKLMQTNQCSEGFDNPSKFREEWDKQTQGK